MTEMPVIYLRVFLENEKGFVFEGFSASGIPPLWFDKRSGKTPADNERDLLHSLTKTEEFYSRQEFGSAWELHHRVTEPVRQILVAQGIASLAAGFGSALMEAAIVDGICRQGEQSFSEALRSGLLGLSQADSAQLPEQPLSFIHLRHTVGLADALEARDLLQPLNDGLPETLEEVVRTYRATYYKVKISADETETLPRLQRVAEILNREAGNYFVTLDGNEQFPDMEAFAIFLDRLRAQKGMSEFLNRILWIEQPVFRDAALDPAAAPALTRINEFKPVIIDESDGEADALDRALALGYSGVSSKTCKGLFRSVSHYLRLRQKGKEGRKGLILSSEDLTTVPVLPLQQDLCLAAALGLTHSERNGHHYIRGFEFLSPAEQEEALTRYPSLYEKSEDAVGRVKITEGGFQLNEVNAAFGFGSNFVPDWPALELLPRDKSNKLLQPAFGGST